MKLQHLLFTLFFSVTTLCLCGQVTSVNYGLEYDSDTELYTAKLYINAGSATTSVERVQANANYSIVTGAGAQFDIVETFNPLQGNVTSGTGTIPATWSISHSVLSPGVEPESDFYSVVPSLAPVGHYNDLLAGDEVDLFTFDMGGCNDNVRVYVNGVDPSSGDEGMNSTDYSNGIFIGGPTQLYTANTETIGGPPVTAIDGPSEICVGDNTIVTPSVGGTWSSSNPAVATVTNTGVVTGTSEGTAELTFTPSVSNGCNGSPLTITVIASPEVFFEGESEICIGDQTYVLPEEGGTWTSSNNAVATVGEEGIVLGVGAGQATLTFTADNGCMSLEELVVTVSEKPEVTVSGPTEICVGGTTQIEPEPTVTGTWSSSNSSILTINNSGFAIGVSPGTATVVFTDISTGCSSLQSEVITVFPSPVVFVTDDQLCVGETTIAGGSSPDLVFVSSNPSIATVDAITGAVTAISPGSAGIIGTSSSTGCASQSVVVMVANVPSVSINGPSEICVGDNTTLSPTTGGTWTSNNNAVCTVTNAGVVTGFSQGVCSCQFTATGTGCISEPLTITVSSCDDPCDDLPGNSQWTTELLPLGPYQTGVVKDYLIAQNLTTANPFDDLLIYDYSNGNIIAMYNRGQGFFEESTVLFNNLNHYENGDQRIYAEDLNGDALVEVIIVDYNAPANSPEITVYQNMDNGEFEFFFGYSLSSFDNFNGEVQFEDMLNDGLNDIIFSTGQGYTILNLGMEINIPTSDSDDCGFMLLDIDLDGDVDIINQFHQLTNEGSGQFTENLEEWIDICDERLYKDPGSNLYFTSSYVLILEPSGGSFQIIGQHQGDFLAEPFAAAIFGFDGRDVVIPTNNGSGAIVYKYPYTETSTPIIIENIYPNRQWHLDLDNDGDTDFIGVIDAQEPVVAYYNPLGTPQISGTAYIDANENGLFDAGETPLRNIVITVEETGQVVLTNDDGTYSLGLDNGNYTLTAEAQQGTWVDSQLTIDLAFTEDCQSGLDFGFVQAAAPPTVDLSIVSYLTRCDEDVRFFIHYENTGGEAVSGTVDLVFDELTSYVSSVGGSLSGNTITWQIEDLQPFKPKTLQFKLHMPDAVLPLPIMEFVGTFTDTDGNATEPYVRTNRLRCAYDPNDKQVHPDRDGEDNKTLLDQELLEYTIRFQNNGNDTAFLVTIVDELDPAVDPNSIQVVGQSHPVKTAIMGRTLTFTFDDIELVDSMTNYAESQGYVSFSCRHKAGIPKNTVIENSADIIFGTNPAIVTNTTTSTMVYDLCEGPFSPCIDYYYAMSNITDWYIQSGGLGGVSTVLHSYEKDSTIAGVTYRKISNQENPAFFYLLLREDIEARKVYAYVSNTASEELMYDFSLAIGEQLVSPLYDAPLEVFDIDTVSSSVGPLLRWHFVDTFSNFTYTYTEGIGGGALDFTLAFVSDPVYVSACVYSGCNKIRGADGCQPNPAYTQRTSEEVQICTGASYLGYTEAGTYTDTVATASGCDSISTLVLAVLPELTSTTAVAICAGETFQGYTETGIYTENLTSTSGCDSVATIELEVLPELTSTADVTICQGADYEGFTESGTYTQEMTAQTGCDSVVTIVLEVVPSLMSTTAVSICQGEVYEGYTESGTYMQELTAQSGCDSVATIELSVTAIVEEEYFVNTCEGSVTLFNGVTYTEPGFYMDTIYGDQCAEIAFELTITHDANPVASFVTTNQVCVGQSIMVTPGLDGTWSSANESVATVAANGTVTGILTGTAALTYTDSATGCASDPIVVTVLTTDDPACAVSVSDADLAALSVYPNPTTGLLHIAANTPITSVQIYSTTGALVQTASSLQGLSVEVDISALPAGVYPILVHTENGTRYQKISKL